MSPLIPGAYPLPENVEMLFVSHGRPRLSAWENGSAALGFTPSLYHNHRPCQTPKSGPRPLRASAVQPDCTFSPRALLLAAILPQLLESTVLQDVDVIDLQPGLGRDLVGRPTHNTPMSSPSFALHRARAGIMRISSQMHGTDGNSEDFLQEAREVLR